MDAMNAVRIVQTKDALASEIEMLLTDAAQLQTMHSAAKNFSDQKARVIDTVMDAMSSYLKRLT